MAGNANAGTGNFVMAGYQVANAFAQAEMIRNQADTQAQIDQFNAELAQFDSWRIKGAGQAAIARYQTQIDLNAGKGKVSAAAAGVDSKSGSLAEIAAENENTGFFNKLDMENRAYEQAMGYNRQAKNIKLNSDIRGITARASANATTVGGLASAAGNAVTGYYANKPISDEFKIPTKPQPSGYGLSSDTGSGSNFLSGQLMDEDLANTYFMP